MKILLMHQTVVAHDAIGNDIAFMSKLLEKEGYRIGFNRENASGLGEIYVYCEYPSGRDDDTYVYIERRQAVLLMQDKDSLIIYHHSGHWEDGEKMLLEAREEARKNECFRRNGRKDVLPAHLIIRYHNVTPPGFFADYSLHYFQNCTKGRRQTETLQDNFPEAWWLCASAYNASEITKVPQERIKIVHPFHKLSEWDHVKPDEKVLGKLRSDSRVKVLFTGRVMPNKGHKALIQMLEDYRENYGDGIVLYIVGKFDGSVSFYIEEIQRRILAAALEKNIHFIGEVTDEELLAYYKGCDYYMSLSDHEGFGVPLIEAQYLGLPVIAKDAAAAGEVLGEGGLLFGDRISHYSAAIAYLEENPEIRNDLIQSGRENCIRRYDNEKAGKDLFDWIKGTVLKEDAE